MRPSTLTGTMTTEPRQPVKKSKRAGRYHRGSETNHTVEA
nr:MAG TPA: hypothetical protein [Caudoviricetes sp.]